MSVWQYRAGDAGRDYSDVCLDFGAAIVGPGEAGPYFENAEDYSTQGKWQYRRWMRDFSETMQPGELIALLSGSRRVRAIGRVDGTYEYVEQFGDVDGWDLNHTRWVTWRRPQSADSVEVPGVAPRQTFQRAGKARARLQDLHDRWTPVRRTKLPPPAEPLEDEALAAILVEHGLQAVQCDLIVATLARLRRLARWYGRTAESVSEHEVRTFLVVPVLQALGWPEQRTKIELFHMDVALFDAPYVGGMEPSIVIETKRPWHGLSNTSHQAERYARSFSSCRSLVVSDGFRYRLFGLGKNGSQREVAYANLLDLRDRHPFRKKIGGASDLFLRLLAPVEPRQ